MDAESRTVSQLTQNVDGLRTAIHGGPLQQMIVDKVLGSKGLTTLLTNLDTRVAAVEGFHTQDERDKAELVRRVKNLEHTTHLRQKRDSLGRFEKGHQ